MKVAICTHSNFGSFSTGESYEVNAKYGDTCFVDIGGFVGRVTGDLVEVQIGPSLATFNAAEAKAPKRKSLLKMLVRAHVNYAKSRGWGDSAKKANGSWKKSGYKSVNDWARCFALGYDLEAIEIEAAEEKNTIDQEYLNWYVDDQMSYY